MSKLLAIAAILTIMWSCNSGSEKNLPDGDWIKGSNADKVEIIERQYDGFSRTMMEVHYRYEELYWAGQDQNWEYANYQLEHIIEAMEKGYERRPEREINSREFLGIPTDIMQQGIDAKDTEQFNKAFIIYNAACKSCHIQEEVSFIQTIIPEHRSGQTRFNPAK
jgi:hypothetical protein